MQVKKDDIEQSIRKEAKRIFLKKGYAQTSMREIASAANVGLSNIYNYYKSKDELFCLIVDPIVKEFSRVLKAYHTPDKIDTSDFWVPEIVEKTSTEYYALLNKYRDLLQLLLFKSAGSSYENFKEDFTDNVTNIMLQYMEQMKKKYPTLKWDFSPFFIHINTVQMFTLLEEIIMHNISQEETKKIFFQYLYYHNYGWKELIYATAKNE